MKNKLLGILLTVLLGAVTAHASTLTLGGTTGGLERQATLGANAVAGGYGDGNTSAAGLTSLFGDSWTIKGDTNDINGLSNGFLTVSLDVGAWGGQPVITGTWTIDSAFYSQFSTAVISMHVGDATLAMNPDFFAWKLDAGALSGTWSYDANTGTGGGLSNLQLWGSGAPRQVPDGSSTITLFGLSLVGMGVVARRRIRA